MYELHVLKKEKNVNQFSQQERYKKLFGEVYWLH